MMVCTMNFRGRGESTGGWIGYERGVNGIEESKMIPTLLLWATRRMGLLFTETDLGIGCRNLKSKVSFEMAVRHLN